MESKTNAKAVKSTTDSDVERALKYQSISKGTHLLADVVAESNLREETDREVRNFRLLSFMEVRMKAKLKR